MSGKSILKWVIYFAALLFFFSLQSASAWRLGVFGVKPDMLPFLVAAVAMLEGYAGGAWFGFAAGLLCDAFAGPHSVFYTFFYFVAGGMVGFLSQAYLQKSYIVALGWAVFMQALSNALKFGYLAVIAAGVTAGDFFRVLGVEAAYSLALSVLPYLILRGTARKLGADRYTARGKRSGLPGIHGRHGTRRSAGRYLRQL